MLKAITFENFILYRERQRLNLSSGPNFIIGANGTGKSSIFELARRCLSQKHNKSISNVHTKEKTGFVVCEYDISKSSIKSKFQDNDIKLNDGPLYTIMFSKYDAPSSDEGHIFKLVLSTGASGNDNGTVYSQVCTSDSRNSLCGEPIVIGMTDPQKIDIINKLCTFINKISGKEECGTSVSEIVEVLTRYMKTSNANANDHSVQLRTKNHCEAILDTLAGSVIFVFGKRSIDPAQTSHSSTRLSSLGNDTEKTKAEIIMDLLQSENLDKDLERKMFASLIFPQEYDFEINEKDVNVINRNTDLKTALIKTSDGIVEAKQLCLLLCNKSYETIFLQSPEKGMHPPMIKKFRDLVLQRITQKTVVVSSHHQSMITGWTLKNTFMCRFQIICNEKSKHGETSVVSCSDISPNAMNDDELKTIPFSEYVLFVEGPSDKKVLRQLLYRLQKSIADNDSQCQILEKVKDKEKLCNFITLLNIIAQDGSKNHRNNKTMCKMLGVPCTFVYDKDVFISKQNKLMLKSLPSYCEEDGTEYIKQEIDTKEHDTTTDLNDESMEKLIEILAEKHAIFMWKSGKIEDAVKEAKKPDPVCSEEHFMKYKQKLAGCSIKCIEQIVDKIAKGESDEWNRFLKFIEDTADKYISHSQRGNHGPTESSNLT